MSVLPSPQPTMHRYRSSVSTSWRITRPPPTSPDIAFIVAATPDTAAAMRSAWSRSSR